VANNVGNNVSVINTQINMTVGSPISVGGGGQWVAITPDGSRAYVTISGGAAGPDVTAINTNTNTVIGSPFEAGMFVQGIAITPAGSRGYVGGEDAVRAVSTQTNTAVGTPITLGGDPFSVAITPNQSPRASLSAPGEGLSATLDGGGSTDDGQIASYEWDFGDGSSARTTTPIVAHAYTRSASSRPSSQCRMERGAGDSCTRDRQRRATGRRTLRSRGPWRRSSSAS